MASHQSAAVDSLPPELLSLVFDFFDGTAPSDDRLKGQPKDDMLRSADCPLKNLSLVSKRWRAIALPILFRHVLWTLEGCDQLLAKPAHDSGPHSHPAAEIPVLDFLRTNDLGRHVRSFTILVRRKSVLGTPPGLSPGTAQPPQRGQAGYGNPFLDAQARQSLVSNFATAYHEDNNWLWDVLFSLMDPLRLTIIASPQTLARLLSCMVFVGDVDFFSTGERLHILSLSRSSKLSSSPSQPSSTPEASSQAPAPTPHCCPGQRKHIPTALFATRPWTHLLLNENSSIRAYRSYHYFDRRPPSILSSLLGLEEAPNNVMMIPLTVTSLSYVAIFPLATHFHILVNHLPWVEHFYVQLVPRNDILLDKEEMDHVQPADLWLECHSCYEPIIGNLLAGSHLGTATADEDDINGSDQGNHASPGTNWRFLRRFEMNDWEVREDSPQLAQLSQAGWQYHSEGVFDKGTVPTNPSHSGNADPLSV
jgi:hypothetical protein